MEWWMKKLRMALFISLKKKKHVNSNKEFDKINASDSINLVLFHFLDWEPKFY